MSDNDQSGLFTFMLGLIVVVLIAVGLSMLVDSRFSYSHGAVENDARISADAKTIEQLTETRREVLLRLSEIEPVRTAALAEREALRVASDRMASDLGNLASTKSGLEQSIQSLELGFSQYRGKYRDSAWTAAVGRALGDLKIRGGREFHQVVITRVTDVGLEIRHEHGLARVQAPDLDAALQDEFQWDDEARRERLKRESVNREKISMIPGTPSTPVAKPKPRVRSVQASPAAGEEEINRLRDKVRAWKTKVAQLDAERQEAMSRASFGSQTSVPGSLETWQARATRLGRQLERARADLAAAKAALENVAPGDRLCLP